MKPTFASIILCGLVISACDSSTDSGPVIIDRPPTISTISDQTITANQPSDSIAFAVFDEQPGALAFTLLSDNTELVPVDGIAVGGTGSGRNLLITPVEDRFGDALVTVVVADASGLAASTSFLLTVVPEQKSLQTFTRSTFAEPADGEPALINAVEFARDAEGDGFEDLLSP